jgi:hypothetical protein
VANGYAHETAYYLNGKLARLAFIAKGVRFPAGRWIRVAGGTVLPWYAEALAADLFPSLGIEGTPIATLLTDFDVQEFEEALEKSGLLGYADADADPD